MPNCVYTCISVRIHHQEPIPVAALSKVWVCCRSPAEIAGLNPTGRYGSVSIVNVVCCQVDISATCRSPVQRCLTECGVSECDREAWIMRRPCPTRLSQCFVLTLSLSNLFYQWRTQEFFSGGSTSSVEDRGQRERRSGGGSPLVSGSTQFANE
jgi:hypothetical protein